MRVNDVKYKSWKIKHDNKIFLYRVKRKKKRKEKRNINNKLGFKKNVTEKKFIAPSNFSIINNSNDTISFFNDIKNCIDDCKTDILRIQLDMEMIKEMTVDALIYLIAVVKNIKNIHRKNTIKQYEFKGNLPLDSKCRSIVVESGFLDHMRSSNVKTAYNSKKLRIYSGDNVDKEELRSICVFVQEQANIDRVKTKPLYGIIGEIMNNAVTHAYSKESINYAQKWLLYVEKANEKFKFTFLDTGLGIPSTINKKLLELTKKDSVLVASALNGESRSQTKQSYRNRGMPSIKEAVISGYIDKLNIISNKACCELVKGSDNISLKDFSTPLNGTLYYWEINCKMEDK